MAVDRVGAPSIRADGVTVDQTPGYELSNGEAGPTGGVGGAGITVSIGNIGQGAPWVGGISWIGATAVSLPGPVVVAAGDPVTGPPLVRLSGAPDSGLDVNLVLAVSNAAGTERIVVGGAVGQTDAEPVLHGYSFAGNPGVTVFVQEGTDLSYDEVTGQVESAAGGVFVVTAFASVSND